MNIYCDNGRKLTTFLVYLLAAICLIYYRAYIPLQKSVL